MAMHTTPGFESLTPATPAAANAVMKSRQKSNSPDETHSSRSGRAVFPAKPLITPYGTVIIVPALPALPRETLSASAGLPIARRCSTASSNS
jgi:hypothetical protein